MRQSVRAAASLSVAVAAMTFLAAEMQALLEEELIDASGEQVRAGCAVACATQPVPAEAVTPITAPEPIGQRVSSREAPEAFRRTIADIACKAIDLVLKSVHLVPKAVHLVLDTRHTRLQDGEIVAIPARLLEDVARDHLLAFDLLFEDVDTNFKGCLRRCHQWVPGLRSAILPEVGAGR